MTTGRVQTGARPGSAPMRAERVEVPGGVVERVARPESPAQIAELVREAAASRTGLLLMGGRTRLDCANDAHGIELGLSLAGHAGIEEFEPDEGVIRVAAGTRIAEVAGVVAGEGWELPLDSPGAASTVGGTVASASAGPRAQRFGPVKDAILGLDVVGGDGVPARCGGRVVKNVTGYDLARLYCGSYGSLAVVTGAWLRLRPAPAVREALRVQGIAPTSESFERARALAALSSVRALVWQEGTPASGASSPEAEILLELAGAAPGVAHDRARAGEAFSFEVIDSGRIDHLRNRRVEPLGAIADAAEASERTPGEVAIRLRVPGSRVDALRLAIRDAGLAISADPGLGVIHARGRLANVGELAAIRLRAERADGFATFEQLPSAWRRRVDVFGTEGESARLLAALRVRFDPAGILNPGRFVRDEREPGSGDESK